MNVSMTGCEVPVRLSPEKQMTTNSWLPPLGTPATDWISVMGPCSVPLNADVTLFVAGEMLKVVPLGLTARKTADPWNPDGHPVVVDQVGVLFTEPLDGFSATAPGAVPMADWAPWAAYPPSNTPPATTTPATHPAIEGAFLLNRGSPPSRRRARP
jgi:hypothetical protein